jgi:hypothetical protein
MRGTGYVLALPSGRASALAHLVGPAGLRCGNWSVPEYDNVSYSAAAPDRIGLMAPCRIVA